MLKRIFELRKPLNSSLCVNLTENELSAIKEYRRRVRKSMGRRRRASRRRVLEECICNMFVSKQYEVIVAIGV